MAKPVTASMPQLLDLADGYIIRLNALDPTTGNAVTGVHVKDVSIFGTDLKGGAVDLSSGPFLLVPGPGA